jgi:hypothetical protein
MLFEVPVLAPPVELPPCVSLPVLPEPVLLEPMLPEPVLPDPVLVPLPLEPEAALEPDLPWLAFHSSRLSLPSWSLSSCSNDWEPDELLAPEAALLSDDLLLCDIY